MAAVALTSVTSCATRRAEPERDTQNMAYLYNPMTNPFNPLYRVINEGGERSTLSVKLFTSELFFSEANPTGEPLASITVNVTLVNQTHGGMISDRAESEVTINRNDGHREYTINVPLTTYDSVEYIADIRVTDNNVRRRVQKFIRFDRVTELSPFNFWLTSVSGRFEPYIPVAMSDDSFLLHYNGPQEDTIYMHRYGYFDHAPYAPFVMLPERRVAREPEEVTAHRWANDNPLTFPERGIYLLTTDSTGNRGFTVFNFGDDYPNTSTPETLIETLAYLATGEEMRSMREHENPKIAIDEFWIARSDNIERSRELLRIYYNRVIYANLYFTSFKEGWRSDRGMIYIIYGPPDKLYKSARGEEWGYSRSTVRSRWGGRYDVEEGYLWFNFRHTASRFTTNHYMLSRTDATPTFWNRAIQSWRNGIVFRVDNPENILQVERGASN